MGFFLVNQMAWQEIKTAGCQRSENFQSGDSTNLPKIPGKTMKTPAGVTQRKLSSQGLPRRPRTTSIPLLPAAHDPHTLPGPSPDRPIPSLFAALLPTSLFKK